MLIPLAPGAGPAAAAADVAVYYSKRRPVDVAGAAVARMSKSSDEDAARCRHMPNNAPALKSK